MNIDTEIFYGSLKFNEKGINEAKKTEVFLITADGFEWINNPALQIDIPTKWNWYNSTTNNDDTVIGLAVGLSLLPEHTWLKSAPNP